MEALCQFFGCQYNCVYADGIDVQELDGEKILEAADRRDCTYQQNAELK